MQSARTLLIGLCCMVATHVASAMPMSDSDVQHILRRLDNELAIRDIYISHRQQLIDSLQAIHLAKPADLHTSSELAELYTSFNNDSALVVYTRAYETALASGQDSIATDFRLKRATLLPLGGFMAEAIKEYNAVDTTAMSIRQKALYYSCGRQMYSFLSSFYSNFPPTRDRYSALSLKTQADLAAMMPPVTPDQMLNHGEYYYLTRQYSLSESLLKELLEQLDETDNRYARAAHIIADISKARGNDNDYIYYLALSAIADTKGATREVTSLQELGQMMFNLNHVDRAHNYLYTALRNAVECNAETRMLQTSAAVPLIESVHRTELARSRQRIYIIMGIMAFTLLLLITALIALRLKIKQMRLLQLHLEDTNKIKETYISQFLDLCSIYMDKLNQFCHIANRKISTGKVDELYKLTKSGKFVENQTKEFYEVFDNAFIHIHPGFVDAVNSLLQPDMQITLQPGEILNTDLRILAFMRLGIEDSGRIAQILNYSVNTIYTYRNKLKNRAISRQTFESDIMSL